VSETEVTDVKTDSTDTKTDSTSDEKPVDNSENGSSEALNEVESGDTGAAQVENGSGKRKSAGDEVVEVPDSTDITPKKAKLDVVEETNGSNNGSGEAIDSTPVETTA